MEKAPSASISGQKGCFIVDADAISRALTADGGAALPEIRRAFGDDVFSGASLDRAKLGQLVFADDAQKRETLNAILHPMILSEIRRQLDRLDAPGQIVVGDVPLLFECGMESMFDTGLGSSERRGKRRFSAFSSATG